MVMADPETHCAGRLKARAGHRGYGDSYYRNHSELDLLCTFLHTRSIPAPFPFPSRNWEACRKLKHTWRPILPSFSRFHPRFSAASIWPNFNPWLSDEKEEILRLFRNEEEVSSEAHATPVLLPTIASNLPAIPPPLPLSLSTYLFLLF